jgi:DNA invertase Pin-like site-specific DNA recombinase
VVGVSARALAPRPHWVLAEIQARGVDLYLHQQALDTSTPSGRAMFQLLGVFAEFERAMIRSRVVAGLNRVRGKKRLGRPPMAESKVGEIKRALIIGRGIRETARATGASTTTVMRVARTLAAGDSHDEVAQ